MTADTQQLLESVDALPNDQLQAFTDEVLRRNASRRSASLSQSETELLKEINKPLPESRVARYRELAEKRKAAALRGDEHNELCDLSDWFEQRNADRIASVTTLAQLRGVTLADLMDQLGLKQLLHAHEAE